MAITLRDIFKPSDAPWEIASKRFAWVFFTSNLIAPLVGDSSVSGQTILEITKAPGAAIMLAAKRYGAGIPMEIYTAITPPAMVAILPLMLANNSLMVMVEI